MASITPTVHNSTRQLTTHQYLHSRSAASASGINKESGGRSSGPRMSTLVSSGLRVPVPTSVLGDAQLI
ncbi:hypothetical protein KC341_g30 [Hortaea werneckii]|nr:hypothetical protein KC341_g30 [Hortaea werneckii]